MQIYFFLYATQQQFSALQNTIYVNCNLAHARQSSANSGPAHRDLDINKNSNYLLQLHEILQHVLEMLAVRKSGKYPKRLILGFGTSS